MSGLGIGAVTGGMIGALTDIGVPDVDAQIYADGLRRGGTIVLVNPANDRDDLAVEILNRHQPVDLKGRVDEWQANRFQGFNEGAEAFAFSKPEKPYHERAAESELDYGPGARTYLSGKPVSDYDRSKVDMGNYVNRPTQDYYMFEFTLPARLRK